MKIVNLSLIGLLTFAFFVSFALAQPESPPGKSAPSTKKEGAPPTKSAPPPIDAKTYDIRLPSEGAGGGNLAVRIYAPKSVDLFRYPEGAPVQVFIAGGFAPGGIRGGAAEVGHGVIGIQYLYPGGRTEDIKSDGVYDYRGMNCIQATRDVIRFALGELADRNGRRLHEIVDGPACYDNVGAIGSSSGGLMFFSTVAQYPEAFKKLAYYVGWENPTTGQTLLFDLGAKNAKNGQPLPNPAFRKYGPTSCEADYSKLKWDANIEVEFADTSLMGAQGDTPPETRKGVLYLDNNGNNRCDVPPVHNPRQPYDQNGNGQIDPDEDWGFAFVAHYENGKLKKIYYSEEVMNAAYERKVFGETGPPEYLPTPEETKAYWRVRNSLPAFPLLKQHNPNLKAILVAGKEDHVQACPAFPGIQQEYDGLRNAGIWCRMNPDAVYTELVLSKALPDLNCDNDANAQIPAGEMLRLAHPIDKDVSKPQFQLAATLELVDRIHAKNSELNLSKVLWERKK